MRDRARRRLEAVAAHEAGHVVVARHLGAADVTARVIRGRRGEFGFTFSGSAQDEAVIMLAGLEAEKLLTGRDNGGSSYDRKRAARALRRSDGTVEQAGNAAARLVRQHSGEIESEALRLAKGGGA